ncbi:fused MFS/spermidine synthase, partial [Candidatus Latescibacterota bacterium]
MGKRTHKIKKSAAQKHAPSYTRLFPIVLGFFFLSGITGLIYEILWTRMIVSIIGSAPFAVSIVLSVFMGGLGLGSYLASKRVDEVREPGRLLRIYGLLELIVGAYGMLLPVVLWIFRPLYAALYNSVFHHFMLYNLLTFAGCAVILILPATCMGATLPVLSRFYIQRISHVGSHLGQLYGVNTIGAAIGSLLCGFWIIGWWGIWVALGIAVAFNILIGLTCISLGGSARYAKPAPDIEPDQHIPVTIFPSGFGWIALTVFAVSGFCAMAYEVIWIRLLELITGPTTFSFTLVVAIFIFGLALGSMFFGHLADRFGRTELLLVGTQIAAALGALAVSQILGNSQFLFAKLIYQFQDRFTTLMLMKSAVIFSLMFLPTFLFGATFPLVGKIYTRSAASVGRSVGFAYAVNTIGAVLGSFCAGFIIIPLIGKENGIRFLVTLQLLTAFGAGLYLVVRQKAYRRALVPVALAVLIGMVGIARYPHWNRLMLAIGKYHRAGTYYLDTIGWFDSLFNWSGRYTSGVTDELVYFGDGIGGFTTVVKTINLLGVNEYSLLNSGKAEASSSNFDMLTQTMLTHFPMMFHPDPRSVMVLGLASGVTAGEVLHYPVERLDVIDINDQVVEASRFFAPWNNHVLDDPRTELIIQDARAHIQMTNRMYDVIISEPSNPWMAGLASLFTREFFEALNRHLNDGGIFCQWMHSYQIDWENFSLIGRTFISQFPHSILVTFNPGRPWPDLLLIGMKGDRTLDPRTAHENFPYAQKSTNMVLPNPDVLFSLILAENLDELFGDGPLNTDSMPLLEFNAPKQAYANDPMIP